MLRVVVRTDIGVAGTAHRKYFASALQMGAQSAVLKQIYGV